MLRGSMCVQNADGDLTEANFGNDDETLSRLEDMGTSFAGKIGADMQRQQQVHCQELPSLCKLDMCYKECYILHSCSNATISNTVVVTHIAASDARLVQVWTGSSRYVVIAAAAKQL